MTEIEFVGYSAVHPSDFIYDIGVCETPQTA